MHLAPEIDDATIPLGPASPRPWKMTSDAYFQLTEMGYFGDKRVELLEGRVVEMPAQLDPHMWGITKSTRAALLAYPDLTRCSVFSQGTLRLSELTNPDPDVYVCACPLGTPWQRRPLPLWVLEVSESTYRLDSTRKLRIYAKAGIGDYWILNLLARRLEVHRDPARVRGRWAYRDVAHLAPGESVTPLAGPPVTFAVDDLLPPVADPA